MKLIKAAGDKPKPRLLTLHTPYLITPAFKNKASFLRQSLDVNIDRTTIFCSLTSIQMEVLNRLHNSVAESFTNCFDSAYRDIIAELSAYDARVKNAEERAKSAQAAHYKAEAEEHVLRREVSLLREEIQEDDMRHKQTEQAAELALQLSEKYEPRRVLGDKGTSSIDVLDIKMIVDRYTELYDQACTVIQASGALRHLVKRHRHKVTLLRAQRERQVNPIMFEDRGMKSPEALLSRSTFVSSRSRFPPSAANSLEERGGDHEKNFAQSGSSVRDGRNNANDIKLLKERPEMTSTPSDTPTDELPPATSARSNGHVETLKRKRIAPGRLFSEIDFSSRKQWKGDSGHPVLVKSETLSPSPPQVRSPQPGPKGTQDLNEVGDDVVTPTKRIRFRRDQSFSAPPDDRPGAIGSFLRAHTELPHQKTLAQHERPRALRPINGNLRRSKGSNQAPGKRRTKDMGAISKISSVTEDGDENRPLKYATKGGGITPQRNYDVRNPLNGNRLSGLLEGTLPANRMLQPITPAKSHMSRSSTEGNPAKVDDGTDVSSDPIPTALKLSRDSPKRGLRKHTTTQGPQLVNQVQALPPDKPFRARPLQQLGLEHFRINPYCNHGLTYAYDEVIRRKDERKCANGCTRPGCCGDKFRAMARFGIPIDATEGTLSDHELLEEYLGKDKGLIDTLGQSDRENLLVEAKARAISNRVGKHRYQHHRSGTPPGFWRTEMPGTQELEDDHEKAQNLEREKVEERYREAVRSGPGGRWTFADE